MTIIAPAQQASTAITRTPETAAALDHTQGLRLVGPPEWPYAQVKDWILLHLDLSHLEVRIYGIMRSLATRWQYDRRLTKDELRWLIPGVNGKPPARSTLDGALRRLGEYGLVVIERDRTITRRVRNAAGRYETVDDLLWRVNELPIERDDYAGPRSVADALDAYPGPGWTDADRRALHDGTLTAPTSRRRGGDGRHSHRRQNSGTDDTWSEQPKRGVSAGQTSDGARQNSGEPCQNSGDRRQNSGDQIALTCENAAHHTYLTDVLTDDYTTTRARAREGTADSQVVVEGEIVSTADIDTAVDGGDHPPVDQDGRTDSHHATAVALVDALPPIGDARPNGTLRRHLVRGVEARLAGGWTADALGAELAADLAGAHSPGVYRARLDALPDRPPQRPSTLDGLDQRLWDLFGGGDSQRRSGGRPPWCGQCDERTRMLPVDDMRVTRCPTCHPLAVRAAAV